MNEGKGEAAGELELARRKERADGIKQTTLNWTSALALT